MRADTTSVGLVAAVAVAVLAFVWVSRINARAQGGAGDTTPPGTATAEETRGEWRELTAEEKRIIVDKGTERAGTGEYDDHFAGGIYTCRRCGAMLYRSDDKFRSDCGWPAFDDEIPAAVTQTLDKGGVRTEITCANCEGHLGHAAGKSPIAAAAACGTAAACSNVMLVGFSSSASSGTHAYSAYPPQRPTLSPNTSSPA